MLFKINILVPVLVSFVLVSAAQFYPTNYENDAEDDYEVSDDFFSLGELLFKSSCEPNPISGISCWDYFETKPDLSEVKFKSANLPSSVFDCRPIISSEFADDEAFVCDNSTWTYVHLDQFPDRLKYLKINGTNITTLQNNSFDGKLIHILDIVDNPVLELIDDDAFQNLDGVQSLQISRNFKLKASDRDDTYFFHPFRHLSLLTHLILESNDLNFANIDSSNKTSATYLHNLTYLSLSDNPLTSIGRSLFHPLRDSNLRDLNLKSANLKNIKNEALHYLKRIEHIDFYDNPGLFSLIWGKYHFRRSLSYLNPTITSLGFGGNNLPLVPKVVLHNSNAQNVKVLNLSGNLLLGMGSSIEALFLGGFPMMTNLENVTLQRCSIIFLFPDTFNQLPNLKHLDLRENMISFLQNGLQLNSLESLDLSYQINVGDTEIEFIIFENAFESMSNLRTLKMSHSKILLLNQTTFRGLTNLKDLHLDHSQLTTLEGGVFKPIKGLKFLDLSFNENLKALTTSSFDGLSELESLSLAFSSHVFTDESRSWSDGLTDLILNLKRLKYLNLTCAFTINCLNSYNYTPPLNPELLKSMDALEVLDMSQNGLASWTDDRFEHNVNLSELYLQKNQLVFISDTFLKTFRRLRRLDFRDNPISCDRNVIKFVNLTIETTTLEVLGWNNGNGYFCIPPKNLTALITFKEYYDNYIDATTFTPEPEPDVWSFWSSGFILGSIFMISIMTIVGFNIYRNRFYIQYFLLIRRRKLKESRDPELDYTYDVFISHSQDSHAWVTEKLLPKLEREEPNLKCCIHERDFQVGVSVTENIVDCIDRSKKFALVLTNGFAGSKWCRFETHLAQNRMLTSGESNLILIVLKDKVDIQDLDKNIRFLLKTWTYLEWTEKVSGQNEFWTRLRSSVLKKDSSLFKLPKHSKIF